MLDQIVIQTRLEKFNIHYGTKTLLSNLKALLVKVETINRFNSRIYLGINQEPSIVIILISFTG